MVAEGHCDACRTFFEACHNALGAFAAFADSFRDALASQPAEPAYPPEIAEAWLADLHADPQENVVPEGACALEWATGRLRAYAADPYRETIALWYAGSRSAFAQLYKESRDVLIGKAKRVVGGEAEDLVEDFFTDLYESWEQGRRMFLPHKGAFIPYAFLCVTHRGYTESTKAKRQHELAEQRYSQPLVQPANELTEAGWFAPEILQIVDETPLEVDERAALELSAEGWSGAEIAEKLGVSVATITRRSASAFGKIVKRVSEVVPPDQLIEPLRELTANHKQRAEAVFFQYTLGEIDRALQEVGLETFPWPSKCKAASLRVGELYRSLAAESTEHPVCQVIRRHVAEPWGLWLREVLGAEFGDGFCPQ